MSAGLSCQFPVLAALLQEKQSPWLIVQVASWAPGLQTLGFLWITKHGPNGNMRFATHTLESLNIALLEGCRFVRFSNLVLYQFLYSAVCLMTCPQPLPKQVLHRVRSSASSFNFLYPSISLRLSSSYLHYLPHPHITSTFPFFHQ